MHKRDKRHKTSQKDSKRNKLVCVSILNRKIFCVIISETHSCKANFHYSDRLSAQHALQKWSRAGIARAVAPGVKEVGKSVFYNFPRFLLKNKTTRKMPWKRIPKRRLAFTCTRRVETGSCVSPRSALARFDFLWLYHPTPRG